MTKEELVRKMINHIHRGEDALWLAEHYQLSANADRELDVLCRELRQGADRLWDRLATLNEELCLGEDLSD